MYDVSDRGRVRSHRRYGPVTPHLLTISRSGRATGYGVATVTLTDAGRTVPRKVSHLVLGAFGPERPAGAVARHLNDDPTDNRIENLAWGTDSDNALDSVRNGTHTWSTRERCPKGHEYSATDSRGARICHECRREATAAYRARKRAAKP